MLNPSLIAAVVWFAWNAGDALTQPPASAPSSQPGEAAPAEEGQPPVIAPVAQAIDPELDALLTRLEASAKDLTSFSARITYEKEDALLGRPELRTGEIIYRIDGENKSFAVLFDSRIINNRKESRLYHYIFDGRWLAEIDQEARQFIKREIVPPGKILDPLKLGEGPFPLPIGQAKSEVLQRFLVTKAEVPANGLLKSLKDVDGLLLIPKPNTPESREYQRVEIFYDRATSLPVGINAIECNDDRKTVKLADLQRNPTMDAAMLSKLNIAEPDPRQWKIDIRPWKPEE